MLDDSSRRLNREEREVTLLFADLQRSTELIASLEAEAAYQLLADVMDCLTAAVMDHDGLVIDYYGDGLAAMWNAPTDQAEHPELACRAALSMRQKLSDVAADWAGVLAARLQLAIGVHTGKAIVGNAGSRRYMKYGPRGPAVHLASRVVAAAKELQVPLVITRSTADRLSNRFTTHRLCQAQLRGAEQAVELFGITTAPSSHTLRDDWFIYGTALELFEQGEFVEAMDALQPLRERSTAVPLRFLACEIERALGRQQCRRSTDRRTAKNGIVALSGA
jgi:adenylate cyclase